MNYIVECIGIRLWVILHEVTNYSFILVFATEAAHVAFAEVLSASKEPVYEYSTKYKTEAVGLIVRPRVLGGLESCHLHRNERSTRSLRLWLKRHALVNQATFDILVVNKMLEPLKAPILPSLGPR